MTLLKKFNPSATSENFQVLESFEKFVNIPNFLNIKNVSIGLDWIRLEHQTSAHSGGA
jgi:hypothetical protein